jgi:hypothetical protein
MKRENIGKVIKILPEKGFGFISSEQYGSIYFKVEDNSVILKVNDLVSFSLDKQCASLQTKFVRKIYVNSYGIKFMSRVNSTHNHLDLDKILPMIYDFVKDYSEDFIEKEITFDFAIGKSICFQTNESDTIIYAKRKNRNGHSRLVLNKSPLETNSIFVVLKKTEIGYLIITIYCGRKAHRELFDPLATREDFKFWQSHALMYNEKDILIESITTECPWDFNTLCIDV